MMRSSKWQGRGDLSSLRASLILSRGGCTGFTAAVLPACGVARRHPATEPPNARRPRSVASTVIHRSLCIRVLSPA
eukprot:306717-Prymnesium_polylepis.1